MRLQRMLLALQWYDLNVIYKKGKDMQLPDTLSRACLEDTKEEIDLNQITVSEFLNISEEKYKLFQERTAEELNTLLEIILQGWPERMKDVPREVQQYFESKCELNVVDGIIYNL